MTMQELAVAAVPAEMAGRVVLLRYNGDRWRIASWYKLDEGGALDDLLQAAMKGFDEAQQKLVNGGLALVSGSELLAYNWRTS